MNWLLGLAAFVVVVAGMRAAQALVAPFLLAMFLAVICTPPLEHLRRKGLPQWAALAIVLSTASLTFLIVVVLAVVSITDFASSAVRLEGELSEVQAQLIEWIGEDDKDEPLDGKDDSVASPADTPEKGKVDVNNSEVGIGGAMVEGNKPESADVSADVNDDSAVESPPNAEGAAGEPAEDTNAAIEEADQPAVAVDDALEPKDKRSLGEEIDDYLKELVRRLVVPNKIIGFFVDLASSLAGVLTNAFLVLVTLAMILLEASGFPAKALALFHGEPTGLRQAEKIRDAVIHYISIKSWVSLIVGVGVAAWTQFLGVPYTVLWGVLAYFFNFVPNIGSIIAAVPAVLVALLQGGEGGRIALALWTTGGYAVINCVIGYVVEPRLMGRGLGLSTLVVFISLVFWGWVLGPVGMLLSVPLTMIAKIILDAAPETQWVAVLLSGDPTAALDDQGVFLAGGEQTGKANV